MTIAGQGQIDQAGQHTVARGAVCLPTTASIVQTAAGQYALVDGGDPDAPLRFVWVETVGGAARAMAAFHLATDAIQLLRYYQDRENAEARRSGQPTGHRTPPFMSG